MKKKVPFEFINQQRGAFRPSPLVTHGVFNLDFIEDRSIVKFDQKGIANRSLGRFVIFNAEFLFLYTVDLSPEGIYARISGGRISAKIIV
jgi:hypothetical protein